jgi:hypothetical protein
LDGRALFVALAAGFHVGFFALAAAVWRFTDRVLDRKMAEERRVPWFVGGALAATYLEVFAWVHGSMRHWPRPATYAGLMVLAGGLVLLVERRFLALRNGAGRHGAESPRLRRDPARRRRPRGDPARSGAPRHSGLAPPRRRPHRALHY